MARTKQTARKTTGGKAPRKQLATKVSSFSQNIRMKKSKSNESLEKLPHEILVLIISHLKLKEAARTSVLSRTWRNLWKYTSGVLEFVKPYYSRTLSPDFDEQTSKMRYIEWVNLVLDTHKASNILEFRVICNLCDENSRVIDNWISFALQRHVKKLVLNFKSYRHMTYTGDYALRIRLFNNSTASLIVLHLVSVRFTTEDLEVIFSKFPMLQVLHIDSIFHIAQLKIGGPLPNLKRLTIRNCLHLCSLEVHAINLLSFVYRGPNIIVTFKVYPRLVEADIPGNILLYIKPYHLSIFFSRLESLVLDLRDWPKFIDLPVFPELLELRRLELYLSGDIFEVFICCCAKLLEACPSLLRFVLKIFNLKGSKYSLNKLHGWTTIKYEQVKIIELIGFVGEEVDVMLAHKLLDMLPSLEKLYVDPNPICSYRFLNNSYEQSIAAAQQLQYSLPPSVDLIVGFRPPRCSI